MALWSLPNWKKYIFLQLNGKENFLYYDYLLVLHSLHFIWTRKMLWIFFLWWHYCFTDVSHFSIAGKFMMKGVIISRWNENGWEVKMNESIFRFLYKFCWRWSKNSKLILLFSETFSNTFICSTLLPIILNIEIISINSVKNPTEKVLLNSFQHHCRGDGVANIIKGKIAWINFYGSSTFSFSPVISFVDIPTTKIRRAKNRLTT